MNKFTSVLIALCCQLAENIEIIAVLCAKQQNAQHEDFIGNAMLCRRCLRKKRETVLETHNQGALVGYKRSYLQLGFTTNSTGATPVELVLKPIRS